MLNVAFLTLCVLFGCSSYVLSNAQSHTSNYRTAILNHIAPNDETVTRNLLNSDFLELLDTNQQTHSAEQHHGLRSLLAPVPRRQICFCCRTHICQFQRCPCSKFLI
ncbi:hypothetical protein M3Y98_00438500 [Aphelenchoides besseyi]|nr:hypothetical protein M3Y98_00438500 [Aphelenchoides besseyi]KAI6202324.1 hypothetical protein M3Y96_00936300 [Aphelenchoides besseyi]